MDELEQEERRRLQALVRGLTPEAARSLGREEDSEGDERKRRARALFAYADAFEALTSGGDVPLPVDPSVDAGGSNGGRPPPQPPTRKRLSIRGLVEERPDPGWTRAEIWQTLIKRGLAPSGTTKASVGVTVGRMAKADELGVTPDGLFTTIELGVPRPPASPPDPTPAGLAGVHE